MSSYTWHCPHCNSRNESEVKMRLECGNCDRRSASSLVLHRSLQISQEASVELIVQQFVQRFEENDFAEIYLGETLSSETFLHLIPPGFEHFRGTASPTNGSDFVSVFKCDRSRQILAFWGSDDLDDGDEPLRLEGYRTEQAYLAALMDIGAELRLPFRVEEVQEVGLSPTVLAIAIQMHQNTVLKLSGD